MEPVNVILFGKNGFCRCNEDLESRIIQVSPKSNNECLYKRGRGRFEADKRE